MRSALTTARTAALNGLHVGQAEQKVLNFKYWQSKLVGEVGCSDAIFAELRQYLVPNNRQLPIDAFRLRLLVVLDDLDAEPSVLPIGRDPQLVKPIVERCDGHSPSLLGRDDLAERADPRKPRAYVGLRHEKGRGKLVGLVLDFPATVRPAMAMQHEVPQLMNSVEPATFGRLGGVEVLMNKKTLCPKRTAAGAVSVWPLPCTSNQPLNDCANLAGSSALPAWRSA
jgi:hypothetical protein